MPTGGWFDPPLLTPPPRKTPAGLVYLAIFFGFTTSALYRYLIPGAADDSTRFWHRPAMTIGIGGYASPSNTLSELGDLFPTNPLDSRGEAGAEKQQRRRFRHRRRGGHQRIEVGRGQVQLRNAVIRLVGGEAANDSAP